MFISIFLNSKCRYWTSFHKAKWTSLNLWRLLNPKPNKIYKRTWLLRYLDQVGWRNLFKTKQQPTPSPEEGHIYSNSITFQSVAPTSKNSLCAFPFISLDLLPQEGFTILWLQNEKYFLYRILCILCSLLSSSSPLVILPFSTHGQSRILQIWRNIIWILFKHCCYVDGHHFKRGNKGSV